ncbi:MAG: Eco57I restriction-modification methylase domain-containing protein [Verrucomicrobia bacterium]|nr:Eco57I restriction-modification methylase domain-containing protein [Verrucomicrobiota bacterium]
MTDLKHQIENGLAGFKGKDLKKAAIAFLNTLGYRSEKVLDLENTPEAFLGQFDRPDAPLNRERALVAHWQTVDLLFQLTDDELSQQRSLFGMNAGQLKSYLFFAIRLRDSDYPRGRFAAVARAINRLFSIPVMVLFAHGEKISIAIINRRAHKRDPAHDVLEKVSLIKDISLASPHRGHLDVLASFSLDELAHAKPIRSFDDLHAAWSERLNIELLNRRFYQRIQEWFFWAAQSVRFPEGGIPNEDLRNRIALIRMLTRIVFCWFARQKGLIPRELFSPETARLVLKRFDHADASDGGYYLAILQNLFFPTLAVPLDQRDFRNLEKCGPRGRNEHYMDHSVFRHQKLFRNPEDLRDLFSNIPFLNGGLFECLDTGTNSRDEVRVDGFSDTLGKQPVVPNVLFFGETVHVDLRDAYGSEKKRDVKVDGLFAILDGYTFTVTENTPVEEEIALDPELLGRIFENLLAEYTPETEQTAKKQTGSFYTPRVIVDYMTGESLKAYLERELVRRVPRCSVADARAGLDILFAYTETEHPFDEEEQRALVDAIYEVRTFDPACGSGAFPMGMLQRLVYILEKLDRDHQRWKNRILDDTPPAMREDTRALLERSSAEHNWKLALIQHSIYGSDIQPIAVQIAKLRCFISLLVDFKVDDQAENKGVPALPNLDFKFVAANSLIPVPGELTMRPGEFALTDAFFENFANAAESFFYVRDPEEKRDLRRKIEALIDQKINERESSVENKREDLRRAEGKVAATEKGARRQEKARRKTEADIARAEREIRLWESYRNLFSFRNAPVGFFDTRYFFPEIKEGFDITIGNPPYVRADEASEWNRIQRKAILESEAYETLWEKWDLFVPFIERAYKLLRPGGVSTMIVSDAFCHSKYAQKSQNWFLQNARILRLDFCSDLKIFDAAVHNLVYFFQKADGTRNKPERRLHKDEFGNVTTLLTGEQRMLTYRMFFPEDGAKSLQGIPISSICYITYGLRPSSDENEAKGEFKTSDLVSETRDKMHCKPYVEGKHLGAWYRLTHLWLEWGTKRAPARFCRPTFQELYPVPEKILAQRSPGPDPIVAYDDEGLVFTPACVGFVPWHYLHEVRNRSIKKTARYKGERPVRHDLPRREDLEATSRRFSVKYLLAVMNSSVAREFLRANRRSNIHLYPDDWKQLPIPDVDAEKQAPIVRLVDKILEAKRKNPEADIAALESEVDSLVTDLYGVATTPTTTTTTTAPGRGRRIAEKDLKEYLRTECLPALGEKYKYFSIDTVRAFLKGQRKTSTGATLKLYLSELVSGLFIHDAGKGWYSFIKEPFQLDPEPTAELVQLLGEKYPLLDFACWSTAQVKHYTHQTLAKFVSFVCAEKHNMDAVFETLRDAGFNAYLNPSKGDADRTFSVRGKTVVVRPSISRQPVSGKLATIEKVLVDLCVEIGNLPLMDVAEYRRMFTNLVASRRIDVAVLSQYAKRRNVHIADLQGQEEHTIATF